MVLMFRIQVTFHEPEQEEMKACRNWAKILIDEIFSILLSEEEKHSKMGTKHKRSLTEGGGGEEGCDSSKFKSLKMENS